MKCPKCRSEVGGQSVCPYCGATVYIQSSNWSTDPYSRRTLIPGEIQSAARSGYDSQELERRVRNLETKMNLALILQCGSFTLLILTLVVLALK